MNEASTGILIVDKALPPVAFAVDILASGGFRPCTASTMRDALSAIDRGDVGLILCGLELEDITGEQFLRYLKKDPLRESIPFVFFLSVENQKILRPKLVIEAGAEDLIFFPLDAQTLVSRVREILKFSGLPGIDVYGKPSSATQGTVADVVGGATQSDDTPPVAERRKEPRKAGETGIAVAVSANGSDWQPGLIVNMSKSGAMIETELERSHGETILVRKLEDAAGDTVSGAVAHLLLDDDRLQVGMGVIFYKAEEWLQFCECLRDTGKNRSNGTISQGVFPIPVEVSRDGFLWVDANISGCDATRAQIKTVMLGKPGETMRVKFEKHGINNIVAGCIEHVGLESEELLAKIDVVFDNGSGWFEVFAHFATLPETAQGGAVAKAPASHTGDTAGDTTSKGETFSKTVLVRNDADDGEESSLLQKETRQKPAAKNERFYHSLIGRRMENYEVVSFISAGAMGGVLKGWDTALERDVALKVISWELSSQERFIEMFFKEARFVSKLNHPNISQIYYIGNADDITFYAMEFVHGENLLELNKKKFHFETNQIVNYLRTICETMDYVWQNRIIHRDIKPANIMLSREGKLKIVDFGVAKHYVAGEKQAEAKIVGSPLYLSPETIRNEKVDHRSDIYSLGATFYHLIAGTPPFIDISLRKILGKHLNEPVPPLKAKSPKTPKHICRIVEKMMSKDAAERFQSYGEIIDSLNRHSR